MRHEEAGKPTTGLVFPGGDPAGHVSYSTIDSQHSRTIEKLNAPDDGHKPKNAITPFRLYDLRHTFLTRLGEANTDPFSIQRIAGHSSIVVSHKYVHPTPERLEDAFSRLETYNEIKIAEMKAKQKAAEVSAAVN
jgi:integrase